MTVVSSPLALGALQSADLAIARGGDVDLDIEWWEEDGQTPIEIQSFDGYISDTDTPGAGTLINLDDLGSVEGNVISLHIPYTVTQAIKDDFGIWSLRAFAVSGEVKILVRGRVAFS